MQQGYAPAQQGYAPQQGYPAPARDDWQHDPAREQRICGRQFARAARTMRRARTMRIRSRGSRAPTARHSRGPPLRSRVRRRDQQGQQYADDRMHDQHGGRRPITTTGRRPARAGRRRDVRRRAAQTRHGGLATALALIGCAMLGTAGAYAYRSYYGNPSSTQPPPVITADSSTPTKIVPASAGDPQSSKAVQDRVATPASEQIVSKQEEPVALKELGPRLLRAWCFRRRSRRCRADHRPAGPPRAHRALPPPHLVRPKGPHRDHSPGWNRRERPAGRRAAAGWAGARRVGPSDHDAAGPQGHGAGDGAIAAATLRCRSSRSPANRLPHRRRAPAPPRCRPPERLDDQLDRRLRRATLLAEERERSAVLLPQPAGQVPQRARRPASRSSAVPISAAKASFTGPM